jgi:hypothetical protein
MHNLVKTARKMIPLEVLEERIKDYGFELNESQTRELYQKYATRARVEEIIPQDQLLEITLMDYAMTSS